MAATGTDIALAKKLLEQDELVAIPTETVYGLAANGLSAAAVLKIYAAKNRPSFNPLILHTSDIDKAAALVEVFPEKAQRLAEKFMPGPLTLVLKKKDIVPDIVSAGMDTVGIRIPRHPLTLELLRTLDFPLAAPSANPSGYVSPTSPQHVQQQLGDKAAYILDGGICAVGIESTIVKVEGEEVTLLRPGGISSEQIQETLGETILGYHAADNHEKPESPGMMATHYAPGKKLLLGNIEKNMKANRGKKTGTLSFSRKYEGVEPHLQFVLSPAGSLEEAARNLFSYLRQLDASDAEIILAEPVPDEGLGRAINDRLRRAGA